MIIKPDSDFDFIPKVPEEFVTSRNKYLSNEQAQKFVNLFTQTSKLHFLLRLVEDLGELSGVASSSTKSGAKTGK